MNANNDDMYVLKKNLFHKVVLKSCSLRIEDNSLIFRIKSNPFKLPLKEITRLHFGEESHSYQIHNKGRAGGTKASCYFTIYTQSNKNINMYCDNEHNIRAWRNGLNRVLLKQNAENILAGDAPTVPAANAPPSNADHDATAAEHTNRGAQGTVD
ncbi:hypothetical protein TOT_020000851 [Theileria orientalis strain Shintoku]|uniref:PH domain-containing protein n=1 Tax=Theileria orientalis strain Shintoku TaxID=869250 RepID=J4C3K4_THEOR|nr:hypothetical protein TOT_020000851 [Theileria orientalis strain Shintoku]BAM40596.1 hypothetical protein TOT_020000851 [Theileria orientalis strain Shintoku]|eukprot:XP_009690897.1 hypothetical protein TOT_020000851 [Theileria orientalis strain Shintoku]